MWRSLVAHLHGVQGVEGSNPFTPTTINVKSLQAAMLGGFCHWRIAWTWPRSVRRRIPSMAIFSGLINTLKSEIARVTRKEMTDELLALRKASTAHRFEVAAMMKMCKREAMRQIQA